MEQALVKKDVPVEIEELHVILMKKVSKREQEDIEEAKKQNELYKNLNPRYFEKRISLKEAKTKIESSDIIFSSKFDIFGAY